MNPFANGLLGLLALQPASGYDLMLRIRPLWPVQHSQIYPTLAKLEADGLVSVSLVEQADRPDKKVYTITAAGLAQVQAWAQEPTAPSTFKDEFTLKAYAMPVLGQAEALRLVQEQRAQGEADLADAQERLRNLLAEEGGEPGPESPWFGRFLLMQRRLMRVQAYLDWCDWAEERISVGRWS